MKKLILLALVVLAGTAFAWNMQRPDLGGQLSAGVLLTPKMYANSATTGSWFDVANYTGGVAFVVTVGKVQNTDTIYCVLQDSTAAVAVAAFDSAIVGAGKDSTVTIKSYRRSGRYVRALLRASGNAADSNTVAVSVVGLKRSR